MILLQSLKEYIVLNYNEKLLIYKFLNVIEKCTTINAGGCLWAIYIFVLYCKDNNIDLKNIKIKQYDEDSLKIETNLKFSLNQSKKSYPVAHFSFLYKNIEFNSGGFEKKKHLKVMILEPLDIEYFCISTLENGKWNERFNVKKEGHKICKVLNVKPTYSFF
jgi:hypothetical protein